MLKQIKEILKDKVKDVRATDRLTSSPACLVTEEHDMGMQMQQIMKAAGQNMPSSKPTLEINLDHKIIKNIHAITDDELLKNWVYILFDQSLLTAGITLDNPNDYVKRLNELLSGETVAS